MVVCSVQGCHSTERTKQNNRCKYSFYRFPRDDKLCREWIKRCQCSKINTVYARVCSRHFKPSDYREARYISSANKVVFSLKRETIPTANLPNWKAMDTKDVVSYGPSTFTITEISDDEEDLSIQPELQGKVKIVSVSAASTPTTTQNTITSQSQTTVIFTQGQYVMANPTISNTTAGKISMVPSNILLSPQSQQPITNLTFQPQQFIYNTAPNQGTGIIQTQMANTSMPITNGTVTANSGMPMKVLLVNRMPQNMNQAINKIQTQSINPTETITYTSATPQVITAPTIKPITSSVQAQQSLLKQPAEDTHDTLPSDITSKSNLAAFRTLLHQIVQMEQQNLEINRQRLEMEKQRFEFEKSVAEKFLAILPKVQFNHNNNCNNNSNVSTGGTSDMLSNGIFCVSPKKEIEDD